MEKGFTLLTINMEDVTVTTMRVNGAELNLSVRRHLGLWKTRMAIF